MREINLTQGKVAIVDDCDYDYLIQFKWFAVYNRGKWYAARKSGSETRALLFMHRDIMRPPDPSMVIDHINGDGLTCTRANMRICTQAENSRNSRPKSNGKIQYKGVSWHNASSSFVAQINTGGKVTHLGCFDTPEAAALAYNDAAKEYFGEYAYLNDVLPFDYKRRESAKRQGSTMPAAKLTESDIPTIRTSNMPTKVLADNYGVSIGLISKIKRRASWSHVL